MLDVPVKLRLTVNNYFKMNNPYLRAFV